MSAVLWTGQWPLLAALVLLALSAALMLLPFLPAWREWRRPRDAAPLPLSPLVAPPLHASQASGTDSPTDLGLVENMIFPNGSKTSTAITRSLRALMRSMMSTTDTASFGTDGRVMVVAISCRISNMAKAA